MNRTRITRIIALPATILVLAGLAVATSMALAGTATSSANQVRTTERALLRAVVAHDTHTAGALLAPDSQLIDVTGTPETRTEYLANIGGQIDFVTDNPVSPISVRVHGNSAVARVKLHLKVVAGGQTTDCGGWTTDLLERRQHDWQLVWSQTTAVPNNEATFIQSLM
jgi:ketosteroid isomerase-like protein